jgi:Ca-activated chloride channel homolog
MSVSRSRRIISFIAFALLFVQVCQTVNFAQSRPQRPESPTGTEKKNQRPAPKTPEQIKKEEEQRKLEEEERNAVPSDEVISVDTNIVSVDAVVFNKKTGQIITGLKKENFAIFEDGVKQNISNFTTPEAPITVSLVLEYSKWTETFGVMGQGGYTSNNGMSEVIRPVAYFLSRFIKPPNDYASVIAFDMRPTTITDFTNDPNRLRQTVDLLVRNNPAFRENCLFDAIKFALVGGKGDSVVLENSESRTAEYSGMTSLKSKRKAIILVASGIDTFSRTNWDDTRRLVQEAGVPLYIITTGNLFFKKYENQMSAAGSVMGPGRLDFHMARNQMMTLAKESGGMMFEMTFESEVPAYLQSINGLLRSQYSLAYDLAEGHQPGKKYKLQVKVDVDGDGVYDEKQYEVRHRLFYSTPGDEKAPKSKK